MNLEEVINFNKAAAMQHKFIFGISGDVCTAGGFGNQEQVERAIMTMFYQNPDLLKWFDEMVQRVKKEKSLKIIKP